MNHMSSHRSSANRDLALASEDLCHNAARLAASPLPKVCSGQDQPSERNGTGVWVSVMGLM